MRCTLSWLDLMLAVLWTINHVVCLWNDPIRVLCSFSDQIIVCNCKWRCRLNWMLIQRCDLFLGFEKETCFDGRLLCMCYAYWLTIKLDQSSFVWYALCYDIIHTFGSHHKCKLNWLNIMQMARYTHKMHAHTPALVCALISYKCLSKGDAGRCPVSIPMPIWFCFHHSGLIMMRMWIERNWVRDGDKSVR